MIEICYADLPALVYGAVALDQGKYMIVVNRTTDLERQAHTIRHELRHIRQDHFTSGVSLLQAEQDADQYAEGAIE